MNARTIQHPGIEIHEIDLTEYQNTITTNNAYVIGFADKGPIYDYSWITTRSEFINLYGEPQTEAEKYLYYAVQSILNNGGTPLVARMPYDNKQCKAYKGLKIKYAAQLTKPDPNLDNEGFLINWENDVDFDGSKHQPLIDITPSGVGKYINPEGYNKVYDTLMDYAEHGTVSLVDKVGNHIVDLTSAGIKELTYTDLLFNLNPAFANYYDTVTESDAKQDTTYAECLSGINLVNRLITYSEVPTHDLTLSGTMFGSTDSENIFVQLKDTVLSPTGKLSAYQSDLEFKLENGNVKTLTTIFETYRDNLPLSATVNDEPSTYDLPDKTDSIREDARTLQYKYNNKPFIQFIKDLLPKFALIQEKILIHNLTHIKQYTSVTGEIDELKKLKYYVTANSKQHDKTISGVIKVLSGSAFSKLNSFSGFDKSKVTISGLFPKDEVPALSTILSGFTPESSFISASLTDVNEKYSSAVEIKYDGKEVGTLSSTQPISAWLNIYEELLNCEESYNQKYETSGVFKRITINGKSPAGLLIPSAVIDPYISGGATFDEALLDKNNNLANINGYNAPSSVVYLSSTIQDYSGVLPVSGVVSGSADWVNMELALARIYNDPYFKAIDTSLSGQAIVDAHLLNTPEINYSNAVYLDSTECEISNEQYDDLVAGSNFTKADKTVSKYGEDIDTANFIIIDKQKSLSQGTGNNEGIFVTLVDPYDGLKMQRLLVNPVNYTLDTNISNATKNTLTYFGCESEYNWKLMFKNEINNLNTLQRVKNADGLWVGEVNNDPGKEQLLDSWSSPLKGTYYEESISKTLMGMFPQIPLTDVAQNANSNTPVCTIDKQYSSHIIVAVCKTVVNPSDGKITVSVLEQFFGSLFDERNNQTGKELYIGNIINANSKYIEFYRNDFLKPATGSGYDPAPYNRTAVPQFFIKDSMQLTNACKMVGIDVDIYDVDNVYFDKNNKRKPKTPAIIEKTYEQYIEDLAKNNIFVFNKKTTIFYNFHPFALFSSFSKKEAQKVIANTTGLFGEAAGTTMNIGDNFIIDMDRCINFIKNVDDMPCYFVCDAGLSTIAQFCDNVIWDQSANNGNGKWVTQVFDPDHDPDPDDRYITGYEDVATWRKVVDKLDQISREIRRDCMTIIDSPRQLTLDGVAPKVRPSRPQNQWDEVIGEKLRFISGINSSYSAGYYNWLRMTDEFSGKAMWLPPTCKIIGNYMYLNIMNLPWLAPAGLNYGVINGIHGISHNPSPAEEDQIYLKSWNYVKQYPFDGFIIEGQKTTLTKDSAFSRVNVRTLFLDLERFTYNVARTFKYTVNNQYTREQFVQTLKPKYEDYMIRGGVYDYLIVCDDTNNTPETIDQQELRCAIYIKPARLIEYIMIDFIAAKTRSKLRRTYTLISN